MEPTCLCCEVGLPSGTRRFTPFASLEETNLTIGEYLTQKGVSYSQKSRICRKCVYQMGVTWKAERLPSKPKVATPSHTSRPRPYSTPKIFTPHKSMLNGKRRLSLLTPRSNKSPLKSTKRLRFSTSPTKVNIGRYNKQNLNISSVCADIKAARYGRGLRKLIAISKPAKLAFEELVHHHICDEAAAYAKKFRFPDFNITNLETFKWSSLVAEFKREMPVFFNAVAAGFKKGYSGAMVSTDSNEKAAFQIATALYHRKPLKFKFLQGAIAVQMWRCGSSAKLFKGLNQLGICQSQNAARRNVDTLAKEMCAELNDWKQKLQNHCDQNAAAAGVKHHSARRTLFECTGGESGAEGDLDDSSDDNDTDYVPMSDGDVSTTPYSSGSEMGKDESKPDPVTDKSNRPPMTLHKEPDLEGGPAGYSFTWDNTQLGQTARHQDRDRGNTHHLWANAYAAENRVPLNVDLSSSTCMNACDIPLTSILPDYSTNKTIMNRMVTIVERILTSHMQCFSDIPVTRHISHKYSEAMSRKSKLVNIGIIDQNPSSAEGVIQIMSYLQTLAPSNHITPTHGDQLSHERMLDAKRARNANQDPANRLELLEPVAQEFHHRGIMLQDIVNAFWKAKSAGEIGTLVQLKNNFMHKSASSKVMETFNHTEDLLKFTGTSLTVLIAMELLAIENKDDIPNNLAENDEDRREQRHQLARQIVHQIWQAPPLTEIASVVDAVVTPQEIDEYHIASSEDDSSDDDDTDRGMDSVWCTCGLKKREEMVACSNLSCEMGRWFHLSCVGLADVVDDCVDWYCSADCEATKISPYCICNTKTEQETIICDNEKCPYGKKFHLTCIHLKQHPDAKWYCSWCLAQDEPDGIKNYCEAMLYLILLDMVHRDCIREGDGDALTDQTKFHIPFFWKNGHNKYLICMHRLIAGVNGYWSPQLSEEITHNRTVNLQGGPGHNLPMDRVNEFLNCAFKETLKHNRGHHTEAVIERAGKIVGPLATDLDRIFLCNISSTDVSECHANNAQKLKKSIEDMTLEYSAQHLFRYEPNRQHHSFPAFHYDRLISKPEKLKIRLLRYAKKMDVARSVLPE